MEPVDLKSTLTNPHSLKELDIMKAKSERQQNSAGSKPPAQSLLTGGCPAKGQSHCVDPGANVKEKFQDQPPDFQKVTDATPKQLQLTCSHERTEPTKTDREISESLGYISYDATTSPWVTFSYELTGSGL